MWPNGTQKNFAKSEFKLGSTKGAAYAFNVTDVLQPIKTYADKAIEHTFTLNDKVFTTSNVLDTALKYLGPLATAAEFGAHLASKPKGESYGLEEASYIGKIIVDSAFLFVTGPVGVAYTLGEFALNVTPEYTAKDGNKYDGWEKAIMCGYDKFSSDKYPYFPSYKYDSQGVKH